MPCSLPALAGQRVEVERHADHLDRVGRDVREFKRVHSAHFTRPLNARQLPWAAPSRPSRRTRSSILEPDSTAMKRADPPWRTTISLTMARPRPVPPEWRLRARSARTNRSKSRALWADVDALPVVGDGHDRLVVLVVRVEAQLAGSRSASRCPRRCGSCASSSRGRPVTLVGWIIVVSTSSVLSSRTRWLSSKSRSSRSTSALWIVGAVLVVSGQPREVVDQGLEPPSFAHHDVAHLSPVRALGVVLGALGRDEQRRQGTSQLVTGVGDELLLELGRGLESVEHRVDRLGHARDLVVAARLGHPFREVRGRDGVDPSPDRLDGREREAHPEIDETARQEEQQRERDRADSRAAPARCARCPRRRRSQRRGRGPAW